MFGNKKNAVEKAIKKRNASALIELTRDRDEEIGFAAIAGLASVGGDDASHYLITILTSEDPKVRIAVAEALGTIANKHTKAFLSAQLQKEEDPEVKNALRNAMVKIKEY